MRRVLKRYRADEQRGIGELMTEQSPGSSFIVRGHAAFHRDYDKIFAEWMGRFADNLFTPDKAKSSGRLRLLQWALYRLVRRLDEQGAYDSSGWIEHSADEIRRMPPGEKMAPHERDLRKHLAALKSLTSSLSILSLHSYLTRSLVRQCQSVGHRRSPGNLISRHSLNRRKSDVAA